MSMLERLVDARNTVEGKVLAVFMSVVLALSFINVSAFANEGESEYTGEAETMAVDDAPAPAADATAASEEPAASTSASATEPAAVEPAAQEPATTPAAEPEAPQPIPSALPPKPAWSALP